MGKIVVITKELKKVKNSVSHYWTKLYFAHEKYLWTVKNSIPTMIVLAFLSSQKSHFYFFYFARLRLNHKITRIF